MSRIFYKIYYKSSSSNRVLCWNSKQLFIMQGLSINSKQGTIDYFLRDRCKKLEDIVKVEEVICND